MIRVLNGLRGTVRNMLLAAIDEGGLRADDLAAFCGQDQRPPIDFVDVDRCAVFGICRIFANKPIVIHKGRRGAPFFLAAFVPNVFSQI